jgi:predicted alpha/beta-hydrolase family hydrolase
MPDRATFLCAHGAGGHKDDRGMLALDKTLSAHGFDVVRFNFPYREKKSRRPDTMPVLKSTIAEVAARAREERKPAKLIIGGRSMGGRAASMLAADGYDCDGLLLLAYPLHPAGQPDKLRDAHLPKIEVPVLCFNGTRDALCRRDLMEKAIAGLRGWEMRWLEGADHSFRVLKSSGRTDAEVLEEIGEASRRWLSTLPP